MKTMSKGILIVALVMSFVMASDYVRAEKSLKIGVVNLQYIMVNSKVAKTIQAQVEAKAKVEQEKLNKDNEKINALKSEIEKKKTVWAREVLQDKVRELQKLDDLRKMAARDASESLQSFNEKLTKPFWDELGKIINEHAKREGFDVILDNTVAQGSAPNILYVDKKLDLSDVIMKELDLNLAKK